MRKTIIFNFVLVFFMAELVLANGFGITLDKIVGDYTVNIDYDAYNGIYAGVPVQFAFQLFNKARDKRIDFNDVWVTISESGTDSSFVPPAFDGGIIQTEFSPAGMTFVFPKKGNYDLWVRYEDKEEKAIVEATFNLSVVGGNPSGESIFSKNFFLGIGAVAIIELLGWVLFKMLRLSRKNPGI